MVGSYLDGRPTAFGLGTGIGVGLDLERVLNRRHPRDGVVVRGNIGVGGAAFQRHLLARLENQRELPRLLVCIGDVRDATQLAQVQKPHLCAHGKRRTARYHSRIVDGPLEKDPGRGGPL